VFLAFSSWCLLATLSRRSDRIAAILYGVFYSGRIGIHFLQGRLFTALQGFECAVIITGLVALAPGLIQAIQISVSAIPRQTARFPSRQLGLFSAAR
jgi:hypothetical protein